MARPTLYNPEKLILVEGWARDGLTNEQIAHNLGITATTLYEWQNKYPEFADTLKRGKEVVDREVENALLKRAMGYRYDEVTKEATPIVTKRMIGGEEVSQTEYKLTVTKVVTKEVQPDVTAQIFWLKNRKPKDWRDKQDLEHTGDISITVKLPEELE